MADGKKQPADTAEALLATMMAESAQLWEVADQFVHSLPVHMRLMHEALQKGTLEHLRKSVSQVQKGATKRNQTALAICFAEMSHALEGSVLQNVAVGIDDLTATILKIKVLLQKDQA